VTSTSIGAVALTVKEAVNRRRAAASFALLNARTP